MLYFYTFSPGPKFYIFKKKNYPSVVTNCLTYSCPKICLKGCINVLCHCRHYCGSKVVNQTSKHLTIYPVSSRLFIKRKIPYSLSCHFSDLNFHLRRKFRTSCSCRLEHCCSSPHDCKVNPFFATATLRLSQFRLF